MLCGNRVQMLSRSGLAAAKHVMPGSFGKIGNLAMRLILFDLWAKQQRLRRTGCRMAHRIGGNESTGEKAETKE